MLGRGMGVGGRRQRIGGASRCVCPSCGYEMPHKRGTPCRRFKCPKCGTPMVGSK